MYPLKFEDILRPMIWGGEEISRFKQLPEVHPGIGESWEISQVGDRISVVCEGEDKGKTITELIKRDGANLLGKHVAARYADKFPLLIKFIDAHDNLSIQVHPNDSLYILCGSYLLRKSRIEACSRFSVDDIPHLGFPE